jgi:hypothetical protein
MIERVTYLASGDSPALPNISLHSPNVNADCARLQTARSRLMESSLMPGGGSVSALGGIL